MARVYRNATDYYQRDPGTLIGLKSDLKGETLDGYQIFHVVYYVDNAKEQRCSYDAIKINGELVYVEASGHSFNSRTEQISHWQPYVTQVRTDDCRKKRARDLVKNFDWY